MFIGCWNIKGLSDPWKHSELHHLLQKERLALFCLVETRVRECNEEMVSKLILQNWSFLYNYEFSHYGRIWIC
jgi:hypothetical protein